MQCKQLSANQCHQGRLMLFVAKGLKKKKTLDCTHQIEVPLWPWLEEGEGAPSSQWPKQCRQEVQAQLEPSERIKYVHCYKIGPQRPVWSWRSALLLEFPVLILSNQPQSRNMSQGWPEEYGRIPPWHLVPVKEWVKTMTLVAAQTGRPVIQRTAASWESHGLQLPTRASAWLELQGTPPTQSGTGQQEQKKILPVRRGKATQDLPTTSFNRPPLLTFNA